MPFYEAGVMFNSTVFAHMPGCSWSLYVRQFAPYPHQHLAPYPEPHKPASSLGSQPPPPWTSCPLPTPALSPLSLWAFRPLLPKHLASDLLQQLDLLALWAFCPHPLGHPPWASPLESSLLAPWALRTPFSIPHASLKMSCEPARAVNCAALSSPAREQSPVTLKKIWDLG